MPTLALYNSLRCPLCRMLWDGAHLNSNCLIRVSSRWSTLGHHRLHPVSAPSLCQGTHCTECSEIPWLTLTSAFLPGCSLCKEPHKHLGPYQLYLLPSYQDTPPAQNVPGHASHSFRQPVKGTRHKQPIQGVSKHNSSPSNLGEVIFLPNS